MHGNRGEAGFSLLIYFTGPMASVRREEGTKDDKVELEALRATDPVLEALTSRDFK